MARRPISPRLAAAVSAALSVAAPVTVIRAQDADSAATPL